MSLDEVSVKINCSICTEENKELRARARQQRIGHPVQKKHFAVWPRKSFFEWEVISSLGDRMWDRNGRKLESRNTRI